MPDKLSKTGRTKFTVENMDWAFLMKALENYKNVLDEASEEDFKKTMMTKQFAMDRVESLLTEFSVDLNA